jgi:hypothetical protein
MLRLVAVLSALMLAVAGCAKTIAGSAVPNGEAVKALSEPLTAKQALGDFSTIDYCGLVNTATLRVIQNLI